MSKEEIRIALALNFMTISSYWSLPYFWRLANGASTSFMAEVYWIPVMIDVSCIALAMIFNYLILAAIIKKVQG